MTFPIIVSSTTAASTSASTSYDITLPANIRAGELIVIFAGWRTAVGDPALTTAPTGFTVANSDDTTPTKAAVMYKVADGTEGGTTATTSVSVSCNGFSAVAMRISGVGSTSPPIQAGANAEVSIDTYFDCPSLTPTFAVPFQLALACSAIRYGGVTTSDAPSGYTLVAYADTGGTTSGLTALVFYKNKGSTSAEDPAQATHNAAGSCTSYSNTAIIEGLYGNALFGAFP